MAHIVKVIPQGNDVYRIEDRKKRWVDYQLHRLEDGYGTEYPFSLVWHWQKWWWSQGLDVYMHATREDGRWVFHGAVSSPGPKHKW